MPLVDALLVALAFVLAYYVRYELQILRPVFEKNHAPFSPFVPYVAIYIVWLFINYRGAGLYRLLRGRSWLEEVYIILNGAANATLLIMAISFFLQPTVFSRLMLVYAAGITVILLAIARIVQRMIRANLRKRGIGVERALIIGVGDIGQTVLRSMIARKELGYVPVGYLDDDPDRGNVDLGRVKGLGKVANLTKVIQENAVSLVVITLRWEDHNLIVQLVRECQRAGAQVRIVPDVFQLNMRQLHVQNLDGIPLLGVSGDQPFIGSNRLAKRALDVAIVVLTAPIWVTFFALIALLIRLDSPGQILYSQERVGENGKRFKMMKFRTMIPNADQMRQQLVQTHQLDPRHPKIKDDPRITRIGKWMRRTSVDELPNFINVLRGHMSLVGPRPPTPDEVELYDPWHRQRLNIMPGITGLWQISGRSDVPFDEMCLLDIYYIENWSIQLDLQILMMTIPRVLLRDGAY